MPNRPRYYTMLRTDKEDQERAALFDAWLSKQTRDNQNRCIYYLYVLTEEKGLPETGAKALLAELFCFASLLPDQRDHMQAHGTAVQRAYEWSRIDELVAV